MISSFELKGLQSWLNQSLSEAGLHTGLMIHPAYSTIHVLSPRIRNAIQPVYSSPIPWLVNAIHPVYSSHWIPAIYSPWRKMKSGGEHTLVDRLGYRVSWPSFTRSHGHPLQGHMTILYSLVLHTWPALLLGLVSLHKRGVNKIPKSDQPCPVIKNAYLQTKRPT